MSSIEVKLSGIVMLLRLAFYKCTSSNRSHAPGIVTPVRLVQLANAPTPIEVTPSGMLMLVKKAAIECIISNRGHW